MNKSAIKIFIAAFFLLCLGEINAQNEKYAIKITQVFLEKKVAIDNVYRSSGEFESSKEEYIRNYMGKDANYLIELVKPNGKTTKEIQNIKWILLEDEKEKTSKDKPKIKQFYPEYKVTKLSECNLYGKKFKPQDYIYKYYFKFQILNDSTQKTKQNKTEPIKFYYNKADCIKDAKSYFEKHKIDTTNCRIDCKEGKGMDSDKIIFSDSVLIAKKTIPLTATDTTNINKENEKDCFSNVINSVSIDSVYNKKNISDNLKKLDSAINCLQESSDDYYTNKGTIIDKVNNILGVLQEKKQQVNFDKKKYFNGGIVELKRGIQELNNINNK